MAEITEAASWARPTTVPAWLARPRISGLVLSTRKGGDSNWWSSARSAGVTFSSEAQTRIT
jgi:hypothetical protein